MSRSYKHTPTWHMFVDKFYKRLSNRITRLDDDVPNGNAYKKNRQTWNICDCRSNPTSLREYMDDPHADPTPDEINEYEKIYRRK